MKKFQKNINDVTVLKDAMSLMKKEFDQSKEKYFGLLKDLFETPRRIANYEERVSKHQTIIMTILKMIESCNYMVTTQKELASNYEVNKKEVKVLFDKMQEGFAKIMDERITEIKDLSSNLEKFIAEQKTAHDIEIQRLNNV